MIKFMCDECGCELNESCPDVLSDRPVLVHGTWEFEIIPTKNGISNKGNLCEACFKELLHHAVIKA